MCRLLVLFLYPVHNCITFSTTDLSIIWSAFTGLFLGHNIWIKFLQYMRWSWISENARTSLSFECNLQAYWNLNFNMQNLYWCTHTSCMLRTWYNVLHWINTWGAQISWVRKDDTMWNTVVNLLPPVIYFNIWLTYYKYLDLEYFSFYS